MIKTLNSRKKIAILTCVLLITILAVLELTGRTNLILDRKPKAVDTTSKTTSDTASAQSNYKSGGNREVAASNEKTDVGIVDTRGVAVVNNSPPIRSADGAITVYSPTSGGLFTGGSSLSGKASGLSKVSYRLMDSVSGVTATGTLEVVNGNFSGKFNFDTKASEGRLDVFQTSPGGIEQSTIEIPVRLR